MNFEDKPIWQLTTKEFFELCKDLLDSKDSVGATTIRSNNDVRYVYGIAGIAKHLNCSKSKVSRIKDSILKPALIENGRSIIADADMLIELYNQNEEYKCREQSNRS